MLPMYSSRKGERYRRNASLVVKAMEKLHIPGDAVAALNQFPGVDRRSEKLADNLYTDYGHHLSKSPPHYNWRANSVKMSCWYTNPTKTSVSMK